MNFTTHLSIVPCKLKMQIIKPFNSLAELPKFCILYFKVHTCVYHFPAKTTEMLHKMNLFYSTSWHMKYWAKFSSVSFLMGEEGLKEKELQIALFSPFPQCHRFQGKWLANRGNSRGQKGYGKVACHLCFSEHPCLLSVSGASAGSERE